MQTYVMLFFFILITLLFFVRGSIKISGFSIWILLYFSIFFVFQYLFLFYDDKDTFVEVFYKNDVKSIVADFFYQYMTLFICCVIVVLVVPDEGNYGSLDLQRLQENLPTSKVLIYSALLISAISVAGILYQLSLTGRGFVDSILNPQKIYFESDGGATGYQANGYVNMIADLVGPASLMLYISHVVERNSGRRGHLFIVGLLFVCQIFVYYVSSSRGLIFGYVASFLILSYLIGVRVKYSLIVIFLAMFFVMFSIMTASRTDVGFVEGLLGGVKTIALYTGGATIFNVAMIDEFYPAASRLWGASLFWFAFAPVPRFIWPDKPLVALDEVVARMVYQYDGAALHTTPPGLFGELIINFGFYISVLVLIFMVYVLLKLSVLILRRALVGSVFSLLLYSLVGSRLLYSCLSSSFSATMMNSLTIIIKIALVYMVVKIVDGFVFRVETKGD